MVKRMSRTRAAGFTLIELLIVLILVGILATLAAPNMRDFVIRNRLKTTASDLHFSIALARSEAVKRNAAVTVEQNGGSWAGGWSVKAGADTLSMQDPYEQILITTKNAAYGTKAFSSITFSGTGREGSSDGVAFVITSAGYPAIPARCVSIDPSGRPAVRQDKDGDSSDGCDS
jgi:type IV fimbrial biogenesis protein FimT